MRDLKLIKLAKEFYKNGIKDEEFIMKAIESSLGGTCEKATKKEDIEKHIDFWWESPKKGRIGIDGKGRKKVNRKDNKYSDDIQWIEMYNVNGKKGWVYGESEYIAFRTSVNIIFVKTETLKIYGEKIIDGKDTVYGIKNKPKECYVPYCRDGNKEVIFKCPTSDLIEISSFIIDLEEC